MNDSCFESKLAPIAGREAFLLALRGRWQDLWIGLNREIWKEQPRPDLILWANRHGVVDPWLIDVLADTIQYWDLKPNSPDARLENGAGWYHSFSRERVPKFRPQLRDSAPNATLIGPRNQVHLVRQLLQNAKLSREKVILAMEQRIEVKEESLDAFRRRMMKQFREQLTDYIMSMRKALEAGNKPQMFTHAEWAALVLSGTSIAEIARAPEWSQVLRRGEPEATVGMAVARFAKRIELTLPRRRLTLGDSLGTSDQKAPLNSTNGHHS